MNTQYLELRERFPEFIYRDFTVEAQDGGFVVRYHFVVPGLTEFRPSLDLIVAFRGPGCG